VNESVNFLELETSRKAMGKHAHRECTLIMNIDSKNDNNNNNNNKKTLTRGVLAGQDGSS
jgi:hypothetical protein